MDKLIQLQNEILEKIKRIEINFKKDSPTRKTREYLEDRLESLDKLWAEFNSNNDKLNASGPINIPYFMENQYEDARQFYNNVRFKISSYPPTKPERAGLSTSFPLSDPVHLQPAQAPPAQAPPAQAPPAQAPPAQAPPAQAPPAHALPQQAHTELLSLQRTNFRAFARLLNSIDLDKICDKWELEDKLRSVQSRWTTIDSLHLQIDNILQGTDEDYESEFSYYENRYEDIKRSLSKKLASAAHIQQATPQIDIPVFTGKYIQWPTFYDLFLESIHNNNLLTKGQKMQHLKGKLRGEAERLIQHLHISAENYDTAWELLTHRYNNHQLLFTKQIELFLNQPVSNNQSAYEIRRLYDTSMECINAIRNLGINTSTWDPLLVHLIIKKLDPETYSDYQENRRAPRELPTLDELMNFLENKFTALEPIQKRKAQPYTPKPSLSHPSNNMKLFTKGKYQQKSHYQATATRAISCPLCQQSHPLFKCYKFLKLSGEEKMRTVLKLKVCPNCLYIHDANGCNSVKRCKECQGDHSTILHEGHHIVFRRPNSTHTTSLFHQARPAVTTASSSYMPTTSTQNNNIPNNNHNVNYVAADNEEILLTTLLLKIQSYDGTYTVLRALLDQGSQISLISKRAAQLLGLPRQNNHASISGIGYGSKQSKGVITMNCMSIYDDYQFSTQALVINKVINNLPNATFNKQPWSHLQNIRLADPDYNMSRPIDLLLDASVYSDILMDGLIKGPNKAPMAQQTRMGWILSGDVRTFNCFVVLNDLREISQYWELEDIQSTTNVHSEEEDICEKLYQSTTRRLADGKYEVAIPMKKDYETFLGTSKSKAVAQFYNLENKMKNNYQFSLSYKQFMHEYLKLGHMRPATKGVEPLYYLPHHGVLKADSTTTKLRTVFNASAKTSSGYSLNDLMLQGPNLQRDLHSLILSWRKHKIVITADIEKMFRQIYVRECDQHLQRIIWRNTPQDLLHEYQLTTVTYGTKAAPYLAMRTLKQLALDNQGEYPLAAQAMLTSFYMDDLLTGERSVEKARELQIQIINIFKKAGMNIRKWSSNSTELTQNLTHEQLDISLDFRCAESRKTLGLRWSPKTDSFTFENKFTDFNDDDHLTKRQLLSNISKIFDPLGWLSPLTIRAKILFQRTWSEKQLSWDDELSPQIIGDWKTLKQDFQQLNQFELPRFLGDDYKYIINGFSDASEKAYACVVYVTTLNSKGEFTTRLLAAKTKLAPLKNKLTLPKLELCGAHLLTTLLNKILAALTVSRYEVHCWSDSTIVLAWIQGHRNKRQKFISTRVQKIVDVVKPSQWHHVSSEQNAADCATRGLTNNQLASHPLWWGPEWLNELDIYTVQNITHLPTYEEITITSVNATLSDSKHMTLILQLINDCSSLARVATRVGWLSRYIQWLRNKHNVPHKTYLSTAELNFAYNIIIKTVQSIEFKDEINCLKQGKTLPKTSKILCLNPYLSEDDELLRVGGRLNHSHLDRSAKNPIILSSHSRLSELIIQQAHSLTLHGGPRLTLAYIRYKYWILSGLRTVKRELRKCVKCRRYTQQNHQQIMADLPAPRVTPSRPFSHTGVDFTGHFEIKAQRGRGIKTTKGYVAVFVCLSTKAAHLELVSDLSTPGFLAAFRRFCARRGTPSHVYSDNGTNFKGAHRLLTREYKEILSTIDRNFFRDIYNFNIEWRFNAPSFPSAGGLWEAAVKSLKYHLRRVIGEQRLTYEEFNTLLHQIEACLNSRPLLALTENPDDDYLTPGHFLIGGPLLSRPQTDPDQLNLNTRWYMVQTMNKSFWKIWSSEYLQQLQVRSKWQSPSRNMEVDDIVLVKEENLPPGKWALGRIVQVHPGKDGYVRVVSVKTKNGIVKRPILRLSRLPVKEDNTIQDNKCTADNGQSNMTSELTQNKQNIIQSNETPPVSRCRLRRNKSCNFIFTTLLMFLFTISPSKGAYNVSYFNTSQSIYFDKQFDINLIRDEWNLVIYYNMTTYWNGLFYLKQYVNHIQNDTDELSPQYISISEQLKHELLELDHYNGLLQFNSNKRQKRGLINGVGYIANSLFGVLDDRFLRRYEKDIETISYNTNHLRGLLKKQTSIIEAQSNILRRNEDIMNKQFSMVQSHLLNVTTKLNQVQSDHEHKLNTLSALLSAQILISSLRRIQDDLIDTITDLSHGHLDVHLIPLEQLQEQMHIISSQLRGDLTLPINEENIQELYKVMKISARVGRSYLVIEIKIPLIAKESFELDKLYSIPRNDYIIETITPYIAFNLQKELLILISEEDTHFCMHLASGRVLCAFDKPIYEQQISNTFCNITTNNKTLCITKANMCEERWIKLRANNRWLFSCCDFCLVRLFCSDTMELITLKGNGLMDIGQGCILKSKSITIYGHSSYLSKLRTQANMPTVPEFSILNHILNSTLPDTFTPDNHNDTWIQMGRQIDNMKQQSDSVYSSISVHDVHHYTVIYVTLILLILVVCIYVVRRARQTSRQFNVAPALVGTTPVILQTVETTNLERSTQQLPSPVGILTSASTSVHNKNSNVNKSEKCIVPRSVRLSVPKISDSELSE